MIKHLKQSIYINVVRMWIERHLAVTYNMADVQKLSPSSVEPGLIICGSPFYRNLTYIVEKNKIVKVNSSSIPTC